MVAIAKHRGHSIRFDESTQTWIYSDCDIPVPDWKDRPCGKCLESNTENGHDACIANMAGVKNACCGHGEPREAFVQFLDGRHLSGIDAFEYQQSEKVGNNL